MSNPSHPSLQAGGGLFIEIDSPDNGETVAPGMVTVTGQYTPPAVVPLTVTLNILGSAVLLQPGPINVTHGPNSSTFTAVFQQVAANKQWLAKALVDNNAGDTAQDISQFSTSP